MLILSVSFRAGDALVKVSLAYPGLLAVPSTVNLEEVLSSGIGTDKTQAAFVSTALSLARVQLSHFRFQDDALALTNVPLSNADHMMGADSHGHGQDVEQQMPSHSVSMFPSTSGVHNLPEFEELLRTSGPSVDWQSNDRSLNMGSLLQSPLDLDAGGSSEFMLASDLLTEVAPNMASSYRTESHPGSSGKLLTSWATPSSISSLYDSKSRRASVTSGLCSPQLLHTDYSMSTTRRDLVQEHETVVAAQDAWSSFRCNPPPKSSVCPKTARIYLDDLTQTLKSWDNWNFWRTEDYGASTAAGVHISIRPFLSSTREKLCAITQTLVLKALESHRRSQWTSPRSYRSPESNTTPFIILPPSNVLENFLWAYVSRFEPYCGWIPAGTLEPNELMQLDDEKVSSLLLLLMVAQGAMVTPTVEARHLSSGLTEVCRISLTDVAERGVTMSSGSGVLRCGLLLVNLAAWSGDKWHMDVSGSLGHTRME